MYGTRTPGKNGTKDKYDLVHSTGNTRMHTFMSANDEAAGKKSSWHELEIIGAIRNLSSTLWMFNHLTSLYLNDNQLVQVPPEITNLHNLVRLDLSSNKIRNLPPEIGEMVTLEELLLQNNQLRNLPRELGRLFRLQVLGLIGNPLPQEIMGPYVESGTQKLLEVFLESLPVTAPQPPPRSWIKVNNLDSHRSSNGIFSVMCYNVLCDKYATKQQYGYCPSWALNWDYRKKAILDELKHSNSDVICLQEVETEQYYSYFLPELKELDYDGIFSPKSRARTISESERKYVDGCAIFYRKSKFSLVKDQLIEFNQLAISAADGSPDMINRVMTKDNIALAALLETKSAFWQNGQASEKPQMILIATCHIHWDPEYCDVKLIQTMMLVHELRNIIEEVQTNLRPRGVQTDCNTLPLILCGDLNSLPDSGVLEYLTTGRVSASHPDFKDHGYSDCLKKFSPPETREVYTHNFALSQAYTEETMPFTNFTYYFRGIIDYIFFSRFTLRPLSVLGAMDINWFVHNKIVGCPHPYIPSDHMPLHVQFELGSNVQASDNRSYQQHMFRR